MGLAGFNLRRRMEQERIEQEAQELLKQKKIEKLEKYGEEVQKPTPKKKIVKKKKE